MQLNLPPDLETLIKKRISSGAYMNAEDVLRRALEAQDAEESWTDEERLALSAHIEEGYRQAERGELIDAGQARREIDTMKQKWRRPFGPSMSAYVPAPLAKADVFEVWTYIAEGRETAAERVQQAIRDACAFLAEGP